MSVLREYCRKGGAARLLREEMCIFARKRGFGREIFLKYGGNRFDIFAKS